MNIVEGVNMTADAISGFFTSSDKTTELSVDTYKVKDYPDVLYLPFYTITAEEIFKGNITMFDVDFFNPKQVYIKRKEALTDQVDPNKWEITSEGRKYKEQHYPNSDDASFIWAMAQKCDMNNYHTSSKEANENIERDSISKEEFERYIKIKPTKLSDVSKEDLKSMDVEYYYYLDENGNEVRTSADNTASALSSVISKWYNALRNIALVLMMSILLYIGIRMLISTVSADKAKYKQMLVDWLVGMCLLFFMHYIMAFSVTLNNKFVSIINAIESDPYVVIFENDKEELLSGGIKKMGYSDFISKDGKKIMWPTNLMGKIRLAAEMRHGRVSFIGFALCFIVLVFYTVFFAFTYLKRVIYLAFLTIIAPFIAMTYPIDKVNDGQAQGFNKWLKEYIFNLLIQPLHLLLYTMLVSSVFSFASQNIWYMLVAIGFLIPAEKLLRSLFGFEKASTPSSLAGAAVGAGLIANGVGKLLHKIPGGSHGRQGRNKELNNGEDGNDPRINFNDEDFDATNSLMPGIGLMNEEENGRVLGEEKEEGKIKDLNTEQALDRYKRDGFKQNTTGEYFNPYTDQYDANYNPLKDKNYMPLELDNLTKSKEGLTNSKGNQQLLLNKKIAQPRKKTPRRTRIKRAMKVGARRVFTGKNVRRALTGVGKKGIRMATGVTLGAVAGTIGAAAGLASGDPSNVFQYGAAGLGAGAVAGSNLAGATMDTVGNGYNAVKNSETRKAMTEAYYGDEEYQQKQQEKQIKQWKKNVEYREQLERTLGEEQAKQMYKQGEIDEYLKHGITEIPDMAAMHQLQEKKVAGNIQEAMAIHEYGERVGGNYNKLRNKDKKEWGETFTEEFQEKGHSKEDSEKATKATFDKIKEYHDIRKNIRTKL